MNTTSGMNASRPPENSAEDIGNEQLKEAIRKILRWRGTPPKLFVAGPSGSGKSATIDLLCKRLGCHKPQQGDPCGKCLGCREFKLGHRNHGLFAEIDWDDPVKFHYIHVNCRNETSATIHDELESIRYSGGIRVVHLEEAASLKRLGCDESVTDLMDDPQFASCHWFASAVSDHGLDLQFRRRWVVKVTTSPASPSEFSLFLARRCGECGIEFDHPATIELLAQRSWRVVGLALAALDAALVLGKLTKPMVVDYPFPESNPWQHKFFET